MRLPIRTLGLVAGAFLMGSALAPVAAQQNQSGIDGQVAVRSDGSVYLIAGGQRRWVATVVISDEEIDRYPEGEPIFVGLQPMGSSQTARTGASTSSGGSSSSSNSRDDRNDRNSNNRNDRNSSNRSEESEDLDPDLPIEVDISAKDGNDTEFERGESFTVEVKTKADAVCDLIAKFPDSDDVPEDSKSADNRGRCKYTIEVPKKAGTGEGRLVGTVRDGGRINRQEITFEVVKSK